jgi:hypothetical protein
MRTSDGDVAMEITYAPKQSGGSSAIMQNVSNTSLTSSVVFRSAPKRGCLPSSSNRTHFCQCQLSKINILGSIFGCHNTDIIPKVSNQKQGALIQPQSPNLQHKAQGMSKLPIWPSENTNSPHPLRMHSKQSFTSWSQTRTTCICNISIIYVAQG